MKKKEEKKANKNENSNNQNFGNNHTQNLTNCSCYNAIHNENLLLFNKEIINKKIYLKKIHLFLLIMNQIHQKTRQKTTKIFCLLIIA